MQLPSCFPSLRFSVALALLLCALNDTWAQELRLLAADHFATQVRPFLAAHCVSCHSGNDAEAALDFGRFMESADVQNEYDLWEKTVRLIHEGQMPPADETRPTPDDITAVLSALQRELEAFDCSAHRRPGRVTLKRLNKAEYNNTIRDLLGLEINPAADFPSDDVGNGFDNIGDVLTLPPILLEKYLATAEEVARLAFADENSRTRILKYETLTEDDRVAVARRNIREFADRAFRRRITDAEEERLFALMKTAWDLDTPPEEILQTAVAAVLSSPHFLFRIEQDPAIDDEDGIRTLDGFELATRLSYFLWSSMPDEELFQHAESGHLLQTDVLEAQVRRMLRHPKSRSLVENFAGQWLQLRDVARLQPDPALFPGVDPDLRQSMRRETELFFETILREDLSVLTFLNADFTFVNQQLAQHYGMADVQGHGFQRVPVGPGRRGVLTQASILMLTSNPTRTSPVKRGKWILENMLAEPPPPPPANVPELETGAETLGSLREQMEQHRSNPACAVCHLKMDALGFGMENFDAVGAWRDRDGRFPIVASGELPGGRTFDGAAELVDILATEKQTEFCRCLTRKMLTYALGRGLVSYDRCTVNDIVTSLKDNNFRFQSLIVAIVTSDPFRMREKSETK
ncbi:MAG: DUF1592 domain-containing protein [Planctomycetaceae bacterium]